MRFKEFLIQTSESIEEPRPSVRMCEHFDPKTSACKTGCPKAEVDKGGKCPFGQFQPTCPCYVKSDEFLMLQQTMESGQGRRVEYKVGDYVEHQPMHGDQPRGRSKNVRITKVLPNNEFEVHSGKIIKRKEILGKNLDFKWKQ